MIRWVELYNFRKHGYLRVDFDQGMTTLVGENDAGKSTVLKAILFALFGVRATGIPSARLWRDGCEGVRAVRLGLDGDTVIYRSPNHAEATHNGKVLASGSAATQAWVEEVWQMPWQQLFTLIYSPQGGTQDLLDLGAAKIQLMVENLAGITLIDNIIKQISPDIARDQLRLQDLGEVEDIEDLREVVKEKERILADLIFAMKTVDKELPALVSSRHLLARQLSQAERFVETSRQIQELSDAITAVGPLPDLPTMKRFLDTLADQKERAKRDWMDSQRAQKDVELATKQDPGRPEGEIVSLDELKDKRVRLVADLDRVQANYKGKECPTCGRPWEDDYDFEAIQAQIEGLKNALQLTDERIAEQRPKVTQLKKHEECQARIIYATEAASLAGSREATYNSVAGKWADLNTRFVEVSSQYAVLRDWQARLNKLSEGHSDYTGPPVSEIERELSLASKRLAESQTLQNELNVQEATTRQSLLRAQETLARAEQKEARRSELLKGLQLLKQLQGYLKTSRARHSKHVWEGLLAQASHLINTATEGRIQGVRRQDNDFVLYDGRLVSDLGGAMKSLVGMSIRIAMSQTFYGPGLPLLLDEATADANDTTAAAIAGMLLGLGSQVIAVSHREGDTINSGTIVEVISGS